MKFLARSQKWVKRHSEVGQEANKLLKKAVLSEVGQETLFVVNGR